jgi:transcriptional regulator with XRE-family HTH domain
MYTMTGGTMRMSIERRMGTAGTLLQRARQTRGWTVREVEALTGLSHGYVGSLETGKRKTLPDLLRDFADLYDLPLVDLLLRGFLERGRDVALRFLGDEARGLCGAGYRLALLRPDGSPLCWQDLGTGELAVTARPGELRCAPADGLGRQAS